MTPGSWTASLDDGHGSWAPSPLPLGGPLAMEGMVGTVATAGPLTMEVGRRRCRIMDDGNGSFAPRIALNRRLLGISSRSGLIGFVRLARRELLGAV
jgi:hypothetical protein